MNKELSVSPTQMNFIESNAFFTLFCGGVGSGKTYSGAVWAALMTQQFPRVPGLITANTHSQLQKATLPEFFKVLEDLGIDYDYKQQSGTIIVGNTKVYAMTVENYVMIKGINAGWAWSDEVAFYEEPAFDTIIGRLRDKNGPCQWKGTTTPNGYNWLFKRFVQNPGQSTRIIYSRTQDNAGNLGTNYIKNLYEQYDPKLAKQELEGQFINLSEGKVYYFFDREKHVQPIQYNNELLTYGIDFNVDPMCAIVSYKKNNVLYIIDEIYLRDSNTFAVAEKIKTSYPSVRKEVVADSTGDKRRTNAKNTDHEILRRYQLDVVKFKNPYVKDRYNNVNRLLSQNRIVIDPKCKKLIEDLEQLVYENQDDMLSHISDALGYVAWHFEPLKKARSQGSITTR